MTQDKTATTAWITGAGSGIGEAAAIGLANAGHRVVLTGRRRAVLDGVAARIAEMNGEALVLEGDVSRPGVATTIAATIERELGRLDVLVNNAGTNVPLRSWDSLSTDGFAEVVEGNLHTAFLTVLAALPIMRQQKSGTIINTASTAGRSIAAQPGPAYTAAKHAVIAMSHSINVEEFAHGIRSTAICPGEVATPIVDKRPNPTDPEALSRMLTPDDVADVIVYIAGLPTRICISELVIVPTYYR
jgi:NADP-dependent 3-hydroxy acid dehydrogenase YdfG